jgi:glutamate synthase (ferredoxin)
MTGGLAYFLDEDGSFSEKVNPEIIKIQRVQTSIGEGQLKALITSHVNRTGSPKGKQILADWGQYLGKFWQAVPPSEADSPQVKGEKALTSV